MKRSLIELFADNIPLMNECLEITKTTYRSYDPAYYLYNQVLAYDYENKFTHDFVELLYVTLTAIEADFLLQNYLQKKIRYRKTF